MTRFARRLADPTRAVRFEVGLMGPGRFARNAP